MLGAMCRQFGKNGKKGFTLVEVIIVLVILAILAAVLIPSLTGYIDEANKKAVLTEAKGVWTAAQTALSEMYAMKLIDRADIKHKACMVLPDGTKYPDYVGRFGMATLYDVQRNGVKDTDVDHKLAYAILKYLDSEDYKTAVYKVDTTVTPNRNETKTLLQYFKKYKTNFVMTVYYGGDGRMKILQFGRDDTLITMYEDGSISVDTDGVLMGNPCSCQKRT